MVCRNDVQLQRIVARAVYDEAFCCRLLNGDRLGVIAPLDLPEAERDAILAIKADSLSVFAQQLLRVLERRDGA